MDGLGHGLTRRVGFGLTDAGAAETSRRLMGRLTALTLGGVLVVAGCSDEADRSPSSSTSSAPSTLVVPGFVDVPDVTGLSSDVATRNLEAVGLLVTLADPAADGGLVTSQSPAAGSRVVDGSIVVLEVT